MLFAQWQDNYCIFTFLDDYRRNPSTAEPYLALTMFDDFLDRKELVLVRGDFSGHLVKPVSGVARRHRLSSHVCRRPTKFST